MRDSVRTIETIVRTYPEMTAKEVLELHNSDVKEHDEWLISKDQEKHDLVKDINENGAYYRGKFGNSQHYYYNILNAKYLNGDIIIDVESLVIFDRSLDPSASNSNEFSLERKKDEYKKYDTYGFQFEDKINKEAWDKVNEYVNNITQLFWK